MSIPFPDRSCAYLTDILQLSEARIVQVPRRELARVLNWIDAAHRLLPDPLPPGREDRW